MAKSKFAHEESFRGYLLVGNHVASSRGDIYRVSVLKNDSRAFWLSYGFTGTAWMMAGKGATEASAMEQSRHEALSRVRARIDLGLFEQNGEYEELITSVTLSEASEVEGPSVSNEKVQFHLLRACDNLLRAQAHSNAIPELDVHGFCALLGITQEDYEYNVRYLLDRGWITEPFDLPRGHAIRDGALAITADGIDQLKQSEEMPAGLATFLSYSNKDKVLAGQVKAALEKHGLDVFMAHEDIDVSKEWAEEIVRRLDSATLFIPLLTPNFRESQWTDQETGYAFARGCVFLPLYTEDNLPHGLIFTVQGQKIDPSNPEDACAKLIDSLKTNSRIQDLINSD